MNRRQWLGAAAGSAWLPGRVALAAPGLQPLPHRAGSGTVLVLQSPEPSARALAQQALQALAQQLDRAPRVLGGMLSREDDAAMLSFAGHQRGTLMQGYLLTQRSGNGARVVVVMDEPARLAASAPQLLAAADAASPASAPSAPPPSIPNPYARLRWVTVPFGSGRVQLPETFRIVGQHQGAVDIVGPNGEVASLGAANQVTTPQAAQYWAARGLPPQTYVAAATGNPVEAFRSVQPQMERFAAARGNPVVRLTNVREAERIPFGNFNAALVASEGMGSIGNRPYRKLSLVAAGGVMANGNWLYYHSEVYAPAELYPQALPVLLKIWNSWSVDTSVLMERLVSAAKSMRETNDILRSVQANREAAQDRLSAAWGHHLRGTVVVRDGDSGRQSTEWLYQPGPAANGVGLEHNRHMSTVVRDANAAAGYQRWQVVNP
ncbi:MAG: hypothetical protein LCI02_16045 [Proteobacteria bacterium]|nr:hypothetical protein [Pseudomonadota bacterium]